MGSLTKSAALVSHLRNKKLLKSEFNSIFKQSDYKVTNLLFKIIHKLQR